jgi:hypothetical protein
VTLRFFPDSQDETCSYTNSSEALTFTTDSIPVLSKCFNIADLFGGNNTRGFANQTRNIQTSHGGQAGIAWQLDNIESFDPQANYSRVLYHETAFHPAEDRYDPGTYGPHRINVYGGANCSQIDPSGAWDLLDWYGFNCWSEAEGNCGTVPYSIASFLVVAGDFNNEDAQHGKCMVFAEMGAASSLQSMRAVVGALVGASTAMWLTW